MFSKTKRWAPAAGAVFALSAASVAIGAATSQTYGQKFSSKHPGQPSGMTFKAAGPVQANAVALTFPAGTKINTAALPRCTSAPNCPNSTRIGSGTATVSIGNTPLPALPVVAYNRAGGMVLVVPSVAPGIPPVVLTPSLNVVTLRVVLPSLVFGGVPLTVNGLQLQVSRIGSKHRAYILTPRRCPKSGAWTFKAQFTYPSPAAPITLKSRSACRKH